MNKSPSSSWEELSINLELVAAKDPSLLGRITPILYWLELTSHEGFSPAMAACWNPRWTKLLHSWGLTITADLPEEAAENMAGFGLFEEKKPLQLKLTASKSILISQIEAVGPVYSQLSFDNLSLGAKRKMAQIGDKFYVLASESGPSNLALLIKQQEQIEAWLADPDHLKLERLA